MLLRKGDSLTQDGETTLPMSQRVPFRWSMITPLTNLVCDSVPVISQGQQRHRATDCGTTCQDVTDYVRMLNRKLQVSFCVYVLSGALFVGEKHVTKT